MEGVDIERDNKALVGQWWHWDNRRYIYHDEIIEFTWQRNEA